MTPAIVIKIPTRIEIDSDSPKTGTANIAVNPGDNEQIIDDFVAPNFPTTYEYPIVDNNPAPMPCIRINGNACCIEKAPK